MEENIIIIGSQKEKTQIVVDNTYIFNCGPDIKNNIIKCKLWYTRNYK